MNLKEPSALSLTTKSRTAQMDDSGEEESEIDEDESVEAELETPKRGPKTSSLHSV